MNEGLICRQLFPKTVQIEKSLGGAGKGGGNPARDMV